MNAAPVAWESVAARVIAKLVRSGKAFSADDVWKGLAMKKVVVPMDERRTMGCVIRKACREHHFRRVGIWVSARASRKGGYLTMWRAA